MHFTVYDVFCSLNCQKTVSAATTATFRVMVILQEQKDINVFSRFGVSP